MEWITFAIHDKSGTGERMAAFVADKTLGMISVSHGIQDGFSFFELLVAFFAYFARHYGACFLKHDGSSGKLWVLLQWWLWLGNNAVFDHLSSVSFKAV
jgi:hypothetical protein